MSFIESKRPQSVLFRVSLGLVAGSMIIALGLFAYLGTFTRYLADDYCETMQVNSGPLLQVMIQNYELVSDRYSNLLFDALSERLFPHNVQILPILMILLWTVALTWLVQEVRRMIGWQWNFWIDFFLAASLAFFSILQAPNRFQTIYWRSGMATHFAPLVYLTAFAAFLLILIRRNGNRYPAIWIGFLCLVISFFGGGFSEPPDAALIVSSALALVAVWIWEKGSRRNSALMFLSWTLAGGVLALIVMALSPGNLTRSQIHRPDFITLVHNTILFAGLFVSDTFLSLPLPTLFSIMIPLFLFYGIFATISSLSPVNMKTLLITMSVIAILGFVLIVAGFAPSVYGQAFPADRARFIGRLSMTAALMSEGGCLGILLSQWKMRWSSAASKVALILLAFSAFYPLHAAWAVVQNKRPYYNRWSSVWDDRQKQIMADKAKGIINITIAMHVYSIEGVEELNSDSKYWINQCAANYYGVQSISLP